MYRRPHIRDHMSSHQIRMRTHFQLAAHSVHVFINYFYSLFLMRLTANAISGKYFQGCRFFCFFFRATIEFAGGYDDCVAQQQIIILQYNLSATKRVPKCKTIFVLNDFVGHAIQENEICINNNFSFILRCVRPSRLVSLCALARTQKKNKMIWIIQHYNAWYILYCANWSI